MSPRQIVALCCFGLMAICGPLCFGAVDRLPQIGLLVFLVIGMVAQPPAVVPLSRWGNRLAIAFVALLLLKEFAPAGWFGNTVWRTAVTHGFSLEMPFTHHPEPGRAIDGMVAGVVGIIWFLWVRRLAADRGNRTILPWILVAAAAVVAIVSFRAFAIRKPNSDLIFGLRMTPGWLGFGPFPNRNHSANYFAMAAVLGCGCVTWAGLKKRWVLTGLGAAMVAVVVVAMLMTQSRGGLLGFAVGFAAFLVLCLLKVRSRRALGVAAGGALVVGALALAFGSQVFARFHTADAMDESKLNRIQVWHDAVGMWKDAPLLGHGIGVFASVFPFYQTIEPENQIFIHPESSWLQWLTELGVLPVLIAAAAGALFLGGHLRESFSRHRSFFLRAGGFAAGATILSHALIDVPAHRWGTAGFALAALAIACPMRMTGRRLFQPPKAALVPLVVIVFWSLPFLWDVPRWSPTALHRVHARWPVPPGVPLSELKESLGWFPLNADLHQYLGLRLLYRHGREAAREWNREFAIASRLKPGASNITRDQAEAVQRFSMAMALPYWQESVLRARIQRDEVLGDALQATGSYPAAQVEWGRFVEKHPEILLAYAQRLPEQRAAYYYRRWWKERGKAPNLNPDEISGFYNLAGRWGSLEQLDEWMTQRASREGQDFREWAALLHAWGDNTRAWNLLAAYTREPPFPAKPSNLPRSQLESAWRMTPENFVNAQQLAQARDIAGENEGRDEILVAVAAMPKAPPWFVQKAAHVLARQGRLPDAVTLLLRAR